MNAKEMIMKSSTIAKTFTIAAVTALALGITPTAKADNRGCSDATLKGTFAVKGTGYITAPPAMAGPLAGVGTETFDGEGGRTATAMLSINGNIIPVTEKGTYKVNSDCTGTYTVQGTPDSHHFFVIHDSGNELEWICIDPGLVLSGSARRQYPVGDWRQ
jgi:hypothetical protein